MSAERCEELARDLTLRYGDLGRGKMHWHIARLREISFGALLAWAIAGCSISGSMCRQRRFERSVSSAVFMDDLS